jgi:hypothetical protein
MKSKLPKAQEKANAKWDIVDIQKINLSIK